MTHVATFSNTIPTFVSLFIYILTAVATWQIFKKMDEPGWKALIPLYNTYVLFKHIWNTKMGYAYMGTGLACGIFAVIAQTLVKSNPQVALGCSLIVFATAIAFFVIKVMGFNKLAKSFGHSTGYTLGLLFFQPIFTMILGFGKDEFQMA